MAKQKLPTNREAGLLACLVSGEKFGQDIRRQFERQQGQKLPVGSLYTTLDRMVDKGFLRSRYGEPLPDRGGLPRKYYRILAAGHRALSAYEAWAASLGGAIHAL